MSANRVGRSDVDGITAYFDNARSQASSNYVIDREARCNYLVPEVAKAWTQAGFNPWSISIEVINTGREASLAGVAGLRQIGRVVSDATRRWGIPVRLGKVSGCRVVRSGVIDHAALGLCGGGHHDIRPYRLAPVIAAAKAWRAPTSSASVACRKLDWHRARARRAGYWSKTRGARAHALKATIRRGRGSCPVR